VSGEGVELEHFKQKMWIDKREVLKRLFTHVKGKLIEGQKTTL
jgi:hypothetical protein